MQTGLSRQSNASLFLGYKICGERVYTSQRPGGILPPQSAVTRSRDRKRRSRPRQVAEHRGVFQRPQETGFGRDCVVGPVGLEPATKRLSRANTREGWGSFHYPF